MQRPDYDTPLLPDEIANVGPRARRAVIISAVLASSLLLYGVAILVS